MFVFRKFLKNPQLLGSGGFEFSDVNDALNSRELRQETQAEALRLAQQAHIFVVDSHALAETLTSRGTVVREGTSDETHIGDMADVPLSFPFKTCWFECISQDNQIPVNDFGPEKDIDGYQIAPIGILVNETSPDRFDAYVLEMAKRRDGMGTIGTNITVFKGLSTEMKYGGFDIDIQLWLRQMILALDRSDVATERCNETLKVRHPSDQKKDRFFSVNQIVRILPKKSRGQVIRPVSSGGKVDWSHRWEVRGHWRKVVMIGKDRNGEYVVPGYTWVTPSTKGPEDAPLIKKTRVVAKVTEEE